MLKTPFTNNRFYMTQKGEAQEGFPFYGEGDVSTLHVDSVPAVRFPMLEWSFMTPGLATNSMFFCFHFVKKSIGLKGKSMTPLWGKTFLFRSSQQLPCLRLTPLKGFLSLHSALQGPLMRCFRNYRETKTSSGVPCWMRRSQDTVNDN